MKERRAVDVFGDAERVAAQLAKVDVRLEERTQRRVGVIALLRDTRVSLLLAGSGLCCALFARDAVELVVVELVVVELVWLITNDRCSCGGPCAVAGRALPRSSRSGHPFRIQSLNLLHALHDQQSSVCSNFFFFFFFPFCLLADRRRSLRSHDAGPSPSSLHGILGCPLTRRCFKLLLVCLVDVSYLGVKGIASKLASMPQ